MDRRFGVAIVLLVLVAPVVFVATYDGPDSDDEVQPVPLAQDPFPPGTFTAPAGDEHDCGEYTEDFSTPIPRMTRGKMSTRASSRRLGRAQPP